MLRYIAAIALIAAPSFYVSIQYKHHAPSANCQTTQPVANTLPAPANEKAKSDICQSEWHPPSWYRLFGWESLQTWGLFLTLIVIADQTQQTSRAAAATEDSLALIKRQADLMKEQLEAARQKERPKLILELEGLDLSLPESPDMILLEARIRNYGGSPAFFCGNIYGCWVGDPKQVRSQPHEGIPMVLPEVLVSHGEPCDPAMFLADPDRVVAWTLWSSDDPRIESIRKGEKAVYLSGFVNYENIFGETWSLGFMREFSVNLGSGRWSRAGDEDNYDRQIYPQKPN